MKKMNRPYYLWTGQQTDHDTSAKEGPCADSGQDAEFKKGMPWFPLTWREALDYIKTMNEKKAFGFKGLGLYLTKGAVGVGMKSGRISMYGLSAKIFTDTFLHG